MVIYFILSTFILISIIKKGDLYSFQAMKLYSLQIHIDLSLKLITILIHLQAILI